MFRLAKYMIFGLVFSAAAIADDDWHEYHHDHHHHHPYYPVERVYVEAPVVEYVPVQPVYYAPPPPAPVYYESYDQRSPQGLVGGMLGSALGYEMGQGNPLASGFGAAAGAWLGNGMNR